MKVALIFSNKKAGNGKFLVSYAVLFVSVCLVGEMFSCKCFKCFTWTYLCSRQLGHFKFQWIKNCNYSFWRCKKVYKNKQDFFEFFLKINFMRKFGYLDPSSTTTSETLYHEDAVRVAIKSMQRYGALNETGILDYATLKVSQRKWCVRTIQFELFFPLKVCEHKFLFSYWTHHDVEFQI